MADWDKFREDADSFNIDYELSRFDESNISSYRETIKELKKLLRLSMLMAPSVNSLKRRILIPRENARQRATADGVSIAYREAIELFKDADKYARDNFETLQIFSKKIALRRKELAKARAQLNEDDTKSIYREMLLTIEICFLIDSWRTFLNQDKSTVEFHE